jgi:hypothetical protein
MRQRCACPVMKTIKIIVTADDIAKGRPANADACPIALAAKRAGLVGTIVVTHKAIGLWYSIGGHPYSFGSVMLPDHVVAWIKNFDLSGRKWSEPIEFEVDVPDSLLESPPTRHPFIADNEPVPA